MANPLSAMWRRRRAHPPNWKHTLNVSIGMPRCLEITTISQCSPQRMYRAAWACAYSTPTWDTSEEVQPSTEGENEWRGSHLKSPSAWPVPRSMNWQPISAHRWTACLIRWIPCAPHARFRKMGKMQVSERWTACLIRWIPCAPTCTFSERRKDGKMHISERWTAGLIRWIPVSHIHVSERWKDGKMPIWERWTACLIRWIPCAAHAQFPFSKKPSNVTFAGDTFVHGIWIYPLHLNKPFCLYPKIFPSTSDNRGACC
jgi:hypothetical protein